MSDEHQGSFFGGLAIGMFAGAAGLFLFGTKDGTKIRKKIEKEWQEAKVSLEKDGLIKDKNASIGDLIKEWCGLETNDKKNSKSKIVKAVTKKNSPAKTSVSTSKTKKKFTGI